MLLKSLIPKYHNSETSRGHPELQLQRRRAFSPLITFFNAITQIWPRRTQGGLCLGACRGDPPSLQTGLLPTALLLKHQRYLPTREEGNTRGELFIPEVQHLSPSLRLLSDEGNFLQHLPRSQISPCGSLSRYKKRVLRLAAAASGENVG